MARTGTVEPTWIAEKGAIVYEDVDLTPAANAAPSSDPTTDELPEDVRERYEALRRLRFGARYDP